MPNLSFVLYFHLISAIILILVASVFIPNQGQIDGYRGQVALLQKPLDLNTLLVLLSILQSTLLASAASSHSATLPTQ